MGKNSTGKDKGMNSNIEETLAMSGFSPQASLASPPPAPESSEEAQMTAGSGRRLFGAYRYSDQYGRFLRTLLESETWYSPEFRLTWKQKPIVKETLETFLLVDSEYTNPQGTGCSMRRWKRSKRLVTKWGRLSVFQLAPSARRTDASGIGSWPTVVRQDDGKTPEAHLRMKREMPGGPRATITSLQVMCKATWPTPAHRDTRSEECSPEFEAARNLEKRGKPLTWAVKSGWPTPTKMDQEEAGAAGTQYLTPTLKPGPISSGCLARTEKFVVRLEILSAWLMAYPWSYLRSWERKGDRRRKTASRTEASSEL